MCLLEGEGTWKGAGQNPVKVNAATRPKDDKKDEESEKSKDKKDKKNKKKGTSVVAAAACPSNAADCKIREFTIDNVKANGNTVAPF